MSKKAKAKTRPREEAGKKSRPMDTSETVVRLRVGRTGLVSFLFAVLRPKDARRTSKLRDPVGNGEGIHWAGKGLARHRSLSVGSSKGGRQQACGLRYGPFSVKSAP